MPRKVLPEGGAPTANGWAKEDGVGRSGVKVLVVEAGPQRTAYVLLDSNNMVMGFRDEIISAVKGLESVMWRL